MEESQLHIPEGWEGRELGTLYLEKRKSKFKVSDATNYGGIPFYTSGDAVLEHNEIQTDGENIFLATGGVANVKFYNGKVAYSTDTYVIVGKENIDTQFLYFKILDLLYYINTNYFQGSGLKHLQKKDFRKHLFALPKTEIEQTTIANILSKTDQAIANTEALIAKYTQIKTGLMQDLLTKGIDENGNIRSEHTHEFKDSPLGRIPKEWECLAIEQVKDFITSGSRGWAKYYSIEGSKFIRITNLKRNQIEIDLSDLKYVKLPASIEGIRSKLMEGDLLISITADLGIIGVVSSTLDDAFVNQHISLVRLNSSIVVPKFVGYFLASSYGQAMFNLLNDGGAKAGLNLKTINSIFVIKPKIEEQQLIVEKFEKATELILKYKEDLSKLQSLKTGLMQDLLSGKVRVNNLKLKEANETALP